MAGKKGRRGSQRTVKGFRPGKEPVDLKRKMAKARLGKDASWAQKQTVEAIAGRSPAEVRTMVKRWSLGLGAVGLILIVLGFFLYGWFWPAGALVQVLAGVALFLAFRIRKQGPGLAEMADSLR